MTRFDAALDRLRAVRHVALDMDGTIYRGGTLFGCTLPFLALLDERGIEYSFLTNNSSRSRAGYLEKLAGMGLRARHDQLRSSTDATIEFLRSRPSPPRALFVLGTSELESELRAAGFDIAGDGPDETVDAVVVGYDTGLVFERLCRAAWWIAAGRMFVATHPDRICPGDEPTVLVDCGAICAALESSTGRAPEAIPGKPDPRMLAGLMNRCGLQARELAMVGDRLYTDIAMARNCGALAILVLSGEAQRADLEGCAHPPDLVVADLAELGSLLARA